MSDLHLPLSIVLGVGLAAATGFRVFLPMLVVSAAAYTGHLPLDNSFAWLATPSALTMLSVAALAEILAYYVPAVDNLLDVLATPAALVAGTIVSAAVMTDVPPMVKSTAAVIAGRRRGRPYARRDGFAQSEIYRPDGWCRKRGPLDCRTRGCAPGFAFGSGCAPCCLGPGYLLSLLGNASDPPSLSKRAPGKPDLAKTRPRRREWPVRDLPLDAENVRLLEQTGSGRRQIERTVLTPCRRGCRAGLAHGHYRDAGRWHVIVGHEEVQRQRDPRHRRDSGRNHEAWAERAGHAAFRVYEDGRRPNRPACRFWDGYKEIG